MTIEVAVASYRKTRGYTLAAALCDEIAFWPTDDSAEPDYAILDALRPGMATIPGALLLCASSPYARRGALFDAHRRYFGKAGPVLVWQAATRVMNPGVSQRVIDEAMARDSASAESEFGALFRGDVERLFGLDAIEACVEPGLRERPPVARVQYVATVDPAGGSGADSMTLCVAHREGERAVIDVVREIRPPFSPEAATRELAGVLDPYRVGRVTGDRYGGEWPRERFRRHLVQYSLSEKPASDLYRDLIPAINSGLVDLVDDDRLVAQLAALERRVGRGGRDHISHPVNGHDDLAVVVAMAVSMILSRPRREPRLSVANTRVVVGEPRAACETFDHGRWR